MLEGSIRRDGDRVRISAQLIDTTTGAHRWAKRSTETLKDVFAVQDEVARTIVTMLAAHLNKAEAERTLLKPPATWQAYDYYLRAADTLASYWSSFKVEDLYETRRLLENALSVDSNYARAYAMLSNTQTTAWLNALDNDYLHPAALERSYQLASKAVQLHPHLPQAHAEFGYVLAFKHQHDRSIAEVQRAASLNPNFTDWRFPFALVFMQEVREGNPDQQVAYATRSVLSCPCARFFGACPLHARTVCGSGASTARVCLTNAELSSRSHHASRNLRPVGATRRGSG